MYPCRFFFFFSSRRRHTRCSRDWSSDVCSSDLLPGCLDGEWMSTPQVRCCQDISYHVEVREGYSWSRSYDLLAPWARTLWQAAERLHTHPQSYRHPQGRANAAQAIRLLAQLGVAVLARGEAEG